MKRTSGTNVTTCSMRYLKNKGKILSDALQKNLKLLMGPQSQGALRFYDDECLREVNAEQAKDKRHVVITSVTVVLVKITGGQSSGVTLQELADLAASLHAQGLHEPALAISTTISKQVKAWIDEGVKGSKSCYGPAFWNLSKSEELNGKFEQAFKAVWECCVGTCFAQTKRLSSKRSSTFMDAVRTFTCNADHKDDGKNQISCATEQLQSYIQGKGAIDQAWLHTAHVVLYSLFSSRNDALAYFLLDKLVLEMQKIIKPLYKYEEIAAYMHGKLALCFFKAEQWQLGFSQHEQSIIYFKLLNLGQEHHHIRIGASIAQLASSFHEEAIAMQRESNQDAMKQSLKKAIILWKLLNRTYPGHYESNLGQSDHWLSVYAESHSEIDGPRDYSGTQVIVHEASESGHASAHTMQSNHGLQISRIVDNTEDLDAKVQDSAGDYQSLSKKLKLAQSHHGISIFKMSLGDMAGAKEAMEKAVNICEYLKGILPANKRFHSQVSTVYFGYADFLNGQGEHEGAVEAQKKSILIREDFQTTNPGKEEKELGFSYHNLGFYLDKLGDDNGAKEAYEKAINIREGLYATDSSHGEALSSSYNNLSSHLHSLGEINAAVAAVEKAVAIRKQLCGPQLGEHDGDLAYSYSTLGFYLNKLDEYEAAKEAIGKSIEIRERMQEAHVGTHENALASSYHNLSYSLNELGDTAGAKSAILKVIELQERLIENSPGLHKELASSYNKLGIYLRQLGDEEGARNALAKSIETIEKFQSIQPGEKDVDISGFYQELASTLR